MRRFALPLLALLWAAPGCISSDDSNDQPRGEGSEGEGAFPGGPPTWHRDIRAIVQANCVMCHRSGGIAPFPLSDHEEAAPRAFSMASAVDAGVMPPWPPDPDCHRIRDERLLTEEEIRLVEEWAEAGAPEGDPGDHVPVDEPGSADIDEPDLVLDAGVAYTADASRTDDYRCLPLSHTFDTTTYVTAVDVQPDQQFMVHHVLLYLVGLADVPTMMALDSADEGPGYTCFGGPKTGGIGTLGGWVPGSPPFSLPEGSAIVVPAGSRVIMQIHYNVLALNTAEAPPDQTRVRLWTLPAAEVPEHLVSMYPLPHTGIVIAAGDPESIHQRDFPLVPGTEIIGVTPHMHTLGTRIQAELRHLDGSTECLVEVPDWDFDWQQFYLYPDDDYVTSKAGDSIRLTCVYDNSPGNQPVVNGEQQRPRVVRWGDSTSDEMCLNYILTRAPFFAGDGGMCPAFEPCLESCPVGDSSCYIQCALIRGVECTSCMTPAVGACAQEQCPAELLSLVGCMGACEDGEICALTECRPQFDTLWACLDPHLRAGECNQHTETCDIEF